VAYDRAGAIIQQMELRMSIISRRGLLRSSAFAGIAAAGSACASNAWAQADLAPTPECKDNDPPTLPEIEGPFYRARTPERFDLVETSARGRQVELTGYVLTRGCRPVERALVDLWHADDGGAYDNRGFRYRGHVFTDEQGRYRFRTIQPGLYPGRTRHYHVKVQAPGQRLLTTQLYFPGEPANARDDFFHRELLMRVAGPGPGMAARFDFVIDMR
jgi:protocatechuate 3,4-dioxygenase beta subunit